MREIFYYHYFNIEKAAVLPAVTPDDSNYTPGQIDRITVEDAMGNKSEYPQGTAPNDFKLRRTERMIRLEDRSSIPPEVTPTTYIELSEDAYFIFEDWDPVNSEKVGTTIRRPTEGIMGVGSLHSTLRRQDRPHGEGSDRNVQLVKET